MPKHSTSPPLSRISQSPSVSPPEPLTGSAWHGENPPQDYFSSPYANPPSPKTSDETLASNTPRELSHPDSRELRDLSESGSKSTLDDLGDADRTGRHSPPAGKADDFEKPARSSSLDEASFLAALAEVDPFKEDLNRTAATQQFEDRVDRRDFILKLTQALLTFGSPSYRIESQLLAASVILEVDAEFVYLPGVIIVVFHNRETKTTRLHTVRSSGRLALTYLHRVHDIYKDVLHNQVRVKTGTKAIDNLLHTKPLYPVFFRCMLAFMCASVICPLAFGGSFVDMWISGTCAAILQFLGLRTAVKSALYAHVYEISISFFISFVAKVLAGIPGHMFCYSAISSAGVVLLLPGFSVLVSSLELTSGNYFCGSVRLIYAIIYTLLLSFTLSISEDFYTTFNPKAFRGAGALASAGDYIHGTFFNTGNDTSVQLSGTFAFVDAATKTHRATKACFHDDPSLPWYHQSFPWWMVFFLVPIYSTCSSLSNLQSVRSWSFPVMVLFSCITYAANKLAARFISNASDVGSAVGAFVISLLGNVYSRVFGGTAFTSMVTGVMFLVPSALSQAGGLTQASNADQQYSSSLTLGIRMVRVAVGVTVGLFVAQTLIYATGNRKQGAHFAF